MSKNKKLKQILFIPDVHVPYEDTKAVELMLEVARREKPDTVVVMGDCADFYAVSSHAKDPNRVNLLEWEVGAVNDFLDKLDSIGAKEYIFVSGNHEDRLERYLMNKAPELFNIVRIDKLFNLEKRGWKYVPYKQDYKVGKIYVTHDTGRAGATAHTDALNAYQDNVVIGHTHRLAYSVVGNARGVPHVGAMFGWLGDVEAVDYMHRISAARNWALGFGWGYQEPNGNVHIRPIPIVDYKCVINGKLYEVSNGRSKKRK